MKVNSQRDISFKSIYTNKALKRSLEFASDNGALFSAATILGFSTCVRPAAIWLAPKSDKENKKFACAKSISSSGAGFTLTYAISRPFANSIKKIDKNPERYLKQDTVKFFTKNEEKLTHSKSYNLATQMFKLGLGLVVAMPKAILTSAVLPYIMQGLFHQKKQEDTNSHNISFKGKSQNKLANGIGKILDKSWMQKFSERFQDSTNISNKIPEDRKRILNYNAGFSTALSIASSYILDKLTQKPTEKFIENFKLANKGLPNIEKQVDGIRIAKPILLMGCVYYMLIPFVSTFLAERATHTNAEVTTK